MTWGPLVAKRCKKTGRVVKVDGSVAARGERVPLREQMLIPDSKNAGRTFQAFVRDLRELGYVVEWQIRRACDAGAPTIRKRFFLIARNDGLPIVWPEPTHGPGTGKRYRTAADIIDFSIPCPSIFERKKPLVENTLRRIARGIQKFVIDCPDPFIVPAEKVIPFITEHANGSSQRNMAADEPLRTQCAQVKGGHFALVAPVIERAFGMSSGCSVQEPLGSITAGGGGKAQWFGRVWCNPPFNRYQRHRWMRKMAAHGNGIMLVPAACETQAFRDYVWGGACSGVMFLFKRPHFYSAAGVRSAANSGCTICLVAYGDHNLEALRRSGLGIVVKEF